MATNPSSAAVRIAKQMAVVILASYAGTIFGFGLYESLDLVGFRFHHRIAGDMSKIAVPLWVVLPIAAAVACILVSHFADHVRPSKLGALLSVVASFVGVCVGEAAAVEGAIRGEGRVGQVLFYLLPAWGGIYSYLGYHGGLIVTRRWHSHQARTDSQTS